MQERRGCIRWQVNRPVQVHLEGALENAECVCKDVNFKGIQISLKQHLSVDKFIKMTIMFSESCCLEVEVWAVWSKKVMDTNLYGFYFAKIKDSDKERIYQFLRCSFPQELRKQCWQGLDRAKGGESMEYGMQDDKRIFSRFEVTLPLKFLELNFNQEGLAQTHDISAKGIGITTKEALTPHTPLEMWLNIPDNGQPLYTRGEVAWSYMDQPNVYRSGIELEKADLMGMSRVLRTI